MWTYRFRSYDDLCSTIMLHLGKPVTSFISPKENGTQGDPPGEVEYISFSEHE